MSMIGIGIRWFFVLLLAASAIGKLADMPGFYAVIKSYALLPEAVIPISAWTLAIFELALAIWLAMGKRIHVAALIVIALHFVYLIWLMIALARGLDIPNCGCFGIYWARPLTWLTLLEDFILLVLAMVMWRSVSVSQRRIHA
jgi:Methylamine utilisation protein MauE